MSLQIGFLGKCFVSLVASVWLVVGVHPEVVYQVPCFIKYFVAPSVLAYILTRAFTMGPIGVRPNLVFTVGPLFYFVISNLNPAIKAVSIILTVKWLETTSKME